MHEIILFAEDYGHEHVVRALVKRVASEFKLDVHVRPVSVRGGSGYVETELKEYVGALMKLREPIPDLVIVATDSNCQGIAERLKRLKQHTQPLTDRVIFAVPDPHIERWVLLDPAAFKTVLGTPCRLPDQKCNRDRYKDLLVQAVSDAGQTPLLGGMEYAEDIIHEMDLRKRKRQHELDDFLIDLRAQCNRWKQQ
jgi:hypothetical protein